MAQNQKNEPREYKRLYLSSDDIKIAGVCGGIAEYLETDPTMIRLLWIVITLITGLIPGLLAYFIAAIVIPKKPESEK